MISLHTNPSMLAAVRVLGAADRATALAAGRVMTGLRVAGALDDASSFAIAQGIRVDMAAAGAVASAKKSAAGLLRVTNAGIEALQGVLQDIRAKATELANPGVSAQQRALLQDGMRNLIDQYDQIVANAGFNGVNLIDGSGETTDVRFNPATTGFASYPPAAGDAVTVSFDIELVGGNGTDNIAPTLTWLVNGREVTGSAIAPGPWTGDQTITDTIALTAADLAAGTTTIQARLTASYPQGGENVDATFDVVQWSNSPSVSQPGGGNPDMSVSSGTFRAGSTVTFDGVFDLPAAVSGADSVTVDVEHVYQRYDAGSWVDVSVIGSEQILNTTGPLPSGYNVGMSGQSFTVPGGSETLLDHRIVTRATVASSSATASLNATYENTVASWSYTAPVQGLDLLWFTSAMVEYTTDVSGEQEQIQRKNLTAGSMSLDTLDFSTASSSLTALSQLDTIDTYIQDQSAYFGAELRTIELGLRFDQAILDATAEGLGNIVDADLARDGAEFVARQVRQQLATDTLASLTKRPQILLGLFRN